MYLLLAYQKQERLTSNVIALIRRHQQRTSLKTLYYFINFNQQNNETTISSSNFFMAQPTVAESNFIKVDQFGYLPNATKVAVISNPQRGFNSAESFKAGNNYQIRNWQNNQVVFSASPVVWNGGATHNQSGDKGWVFNFSSVKTPGSYYVYDVNISE